MHEYRIVVKVVAKSAPGTRGGTTSYYLKLAPGTPGAPAFARDLHINRSTYQRVKEAGAVAVTSRAGRLNIPWISHVEYR